MYVNCAMLSIIDLVTSVKTRCFTIFTQTPMSCASFGTHNKQPWGTATTAWIDSVSNTGSNRSLARKRNVQRKISTYRLMRACNVSFVIWRELSTDPHNVNKRARWRKDLVETLSPVAAKAVVSPNNGARFGSCYGGWIGKCLCLQHNHAKLPEFEGLDLKFESSSRVKDKVQKKHSDIAHLFQQFTACD